MGVIIHYDFRRAERHKEMEEIRTRTRDRLIKSIENPSYYNNTEVVKQSQRDNMRYMELQKEDEEWEGKDRWVELY